MHVDGVPAFFEFCTPWGRIMECEMMVGAHRVVVRLDRGRFWFFTGGVFSVTHSVLVDGVHVGTYDDGGVFTQAAAARASA